MLAEFLHDTEGIRGVPRLLIIPRHLSYIQGRREQIQAMEKQPPPPPPARADEVKTKTVATYLDPESRALPFRRHCL